MIRMMTRAFGLLSILAVPAVSGYAFVGNTSVGGLNPTETYFLAGPGGTVAPGSC